MKRHIRGMHFLYCPWPPLIACQIWINTSCIIETNVKYGPMEVSNEASVKLSGARPSYIAGVAIARIGRQESIARNIMATRPGRDYMAVNLWKQKLDKDVGKRYIHWQRPTYPGKTTRFLMATMLEKENSSTIAQWLWLGVQIQQSSWRPKHPF